MLKLTDEARLERGREIKNDELTIEESSAKIIRAKIREYTIELDLKERLLKRNCDDWRKGLGVKRVCKHIVKLLLTMPEDKANKILKDIIQNRDDWKFQLSV